MNTILITGSNRGLGLGFVKAYLAKGDKVIATCRNPQAAIELQELAKSNPNLSILPLDVTSDESLQTLVSTLAINKIEVLVNNVGVNSRSVNADASKTRKLKNIDRNIMLEMFNVNAVSPLMVTKYLLPLLEVGKGTIINISTQRASFNDPDPSEDPNYGYCSSKVALNMFTNELAKEITSLGIKTFAVHPGGVKTDMNAQYGEIQPQTAAENIIKIAENLTVDDSGKFFNFDGKLFPL